MTRPHHLFRTRTGRTLATTLVLVLLMGVAALPAQADLTPDTRIGDAETPTAASIDITASTLADGQAARVILGRNDLFPDNLAGAGAAGVDGALLLVDPAPAGLDDDVAAEIGRLLPEEGPEECGTGLDAEVVLLGGEAALSAALADSLAENFCVDRLFGPSRVETSVEVALSMLGAGSDRSTLLIARDDNPADSAAAGAYAAATGTPIVVTSSTSLHPAVRALLDPSGGQWGRVILLGGEAALSAEVAQEVAAAAGAGTAVGRIAGTARDDTALQIALQLWDGLAGDQVAIVNGYSADFWTYALPGGVAASASSAPLLYVNTDLVPATTAGYLTERRPGVTTVGPASQVSEATKASAESGGGPIPPTGLGDDVRIVPLDLTDGTVTVTTMPGDYSITLTIRAEDSTSPIFWESVSGPGLELDGPSLAAYDGQLSDSALIVPFLPSHPAIQPGDYTFTASSDAELLQARAIIKSGDPGARQVLDVNFFVVTDHPSVDEQSERDALATIYRNTGESILGGQGLGVGNIRFVDANDDLRELYQTLTLPAGDENRNIRGLCGALRSLSGESRAINFAVVDRIVDDPEPEDGGETLGISAGIPGSPIVGELENSCVVLPAASQFALDAQGTTVWHEAGHFLGLFHTSEADGENFDPLPDTPECTIESDTNGDGETDEDECGPLGDNFMYYNTDDLTMTAHQAFVLRHNPMMRPAA